MISMISRAVQRFRQLPFFLRAALYAAALALVLGVPTALVPFPFLHYIRMVPATPLDYVFLALVSLLLGAYLALRSEPCCGSVAKGGGESAATEAGDAATKKDGAALAGAAGGVIAFGCPVCNVFLVSLLGSTAVLAYVEPARPWIGLASILVLGLTAYALLPKRLP